MTQSCVLSCSVMSDSATPWTVAHQAPLSVESSRQEYWSGLSCTPPKNLPNPSPLHFRKILYHLSHQGSPGHRENWIICPRSNSCVRTGANTYACTCLLCCPSNCNWTWNSHKCNVPGAILCTFAYAIPSVWQTSIDHFKLNFSVFPTELWYLTGYKIMNSFFYLFI